MDRECGSSDPDSIGNKGGGMVNGVQDIGGNANNDTAEQEMNSGSILSPLFSGTKPKKRLTSSVWEDFVPTFVDRKLSQAECMHCHRVFNCKGTTGTTSLRNHQALCSPGTQKRPRLQEHTSLAYTQKSKAAVCNDPKQKKLTFFLSNPKKCMGTTTTQKELELPKCPSDATRRNQEVHQNEPRERLVAHEGKNLAFPDISAEKNVDTPSHRENALPEQNLHSVMNRRNLEVGQSCFPKEVFRILAMQGHHPRTIEQDGFKKFVSWLNPIVKMPSHADVIVNFWNLYRQEESKLKEKLTTLQSRVCLSAYIWYYDPHLRFLCLSVHYIDDEWVKQQRIIRFSLVDPSWSSEKLIWELPTIISLDIKKWGLHDKVFCIILDDAFSNGSVVSNIKIHFQEHSKVAATRSLFVVRYATHLIDGVIQILVNELDRIMEKSRKHSDYKIGPISSVVQYPNCRYAPAIQDWRKTQKICETLKDFHEDMDFILNSPSSADVFDKLWDVKEEVYPKADMCSMYRQRTSDYLEKQAFSNVRWEMQKEFDERWKVCFFHICMPMVMDPKYRLKRIKSRIQDFSIASSYSLDEDIDDYIHYVHDTLLSLFDEYSRKVEDPNCISGSTITKKKLVNGDDLVEYYLDTEYDCPYIQRPLSELDQYLREPHLTKGDPTALQWWKEHSLTYPTLARMARDILALPSSTDCKVATSTARKAMAESSHRNLIEQLVCTQDWLNPTGTATVELTNE